MEIERQRCPRCELTLPLEAFSPSQRIMGRWCRQCNADARREKRNGIEGGRRHTHCLECGTELTGAPQQKYCSSACNMKHWRAQRPSYGRDYQLANTYGISREQYDAMLDEQGNACAICLRSFDDVKACVDHCHAKGHVRGVLCSGCNTGLGGFRDDIAALARAIEYLKL